MIERFLAEQEAKITKRWRPLIERYARRVYKQTHRIGMSRDDVIQDLSIVVVELHRNWLFQRQRIPDVPLVKHALGWRVSKLNREITSKFRAASDTDVAEGDMDVFAVDPDDTVEIIERQVACSALFYELRVALRPDQISLMYLRHAEGLTPAQIAKLTGAGNKDVSRRLWEATRQARDFLATLGIEEWDDVLDTRPEDYRAAER